jgi:sucrose phosphorylase
MNDAELRIRELLVFLYGKEGSRVWQALHPKLKAFRRQHSERSEAPSAPERCLSERDAFLITYGDQITEPGRAPLQTLADFLDRWVEDAIGGVHLLPFFPYSSDDGFAIVDHRRVDPRLGSWADVEALARRRRLMVDAVINHVSSQHPWFEAFKQRKAPYHDYFIVTTPKAALSKVVRPRTSPLLTPVKTVQGTQYVWTTFSADQIDLNYKNPHVLLEIIDLLLFYVAHGAQVLRLDAVAYLWKELNTSCIHLPQTHALVKLFRAVLDVTAPGVLLITETNVPHQENVQYFGDGGDEAQLVYNFALPPLVLHAFHTGSARRLAEWAQTLKVPPACGFFNFLASHDGIGLLPARGILSDDEVKELVKRAEVHGGLISYRAGPDGSKEPYELNITFYDALNDPSTPDDQRDIRRFLAAQAIMLSLAGVPGLYAHSLLGSRNCHKCVQNTGLARSINREKFQRQALEAELTDGTSRRARVFRGYLKLLKVRQEHPAFHPFGKQHILHADEGTFALVREAPDNSETLLALIDVSGRARRVPVDVVRDKLPSVERWQDLLSGEILTACERHLVVPLDGYQVRWLAPLR